MNRRSVSALLLLTLTFLLNACGPTTAGNIVIGEGETYRGSLRALSANVTLAEGSRVPGSVLVLCCNIIAEGRVDGDLVLGSGNLMLGETAEIGGDVILQSGNLARLPGAQVQGAIQSPAGIGFLLRLLAPFCLSALAGLLIVVLILWVRRRRKGSVMI